jgi:superfamily II DNA or RNA helicase
MSPPATALTSLQIVGEMKLAERAQVLDAFRKGTIPVLINVNVLTEGTVRLLRSLPS